MSALRTARGREGLSDSSHALATIEVLESDLETWDRLAQRERWFSSATGLLAGVGVGVAGWGSWPTGLAFGLASCITLSAYMLWRRERNALQRSIWMSVARSGESVDGSNHKSRSSSAEAAP